MLRSSCLLWCAAALSVSACGVSGPDSSGVAGKADSLHECAEGQTCLQARDYEVLFTNPICADYLYTEGVESTSGDELAGKPKNVYCTHDDSEASGQRESSPQFRLSEWIDDLDDGDELFLAYLSFSDPLITSKLCEAVDRGVDVDFVLDKFSNSAETLQDCGGNIMIRGHQGSVGFQHNKIFLVNPNGPGPNDTGDDKKFMRMSFGSGNMSSGTHLHHENWHFAEVARKSYFAEWHRCLRKALIDPAHTDGKGAFRSFMDDCRDDIDFPEEDDIKAFFIPNLTDSKAALAVLEDKVSKAQRIDIGAHRFSLSELVNQLLDRLDEDSEFEVRLVADDDLYWTSPAVGSAREIGPNTFHEGDLVEELENTGGDRFEARYLETNHSSHLLHHNKYLIFQDVEGEADSLLYGAANLTGTGYKSNLENIYWTNIPVIVEAFKAQYGAFWDGDSLRGGSEQVPPLATAVEDMPVDLFDVAPVE